MFNQSDKVVCVAPMEFVNGCGSPVGPPEVGKVYCVKEVIKCSFNYEKFEGLNLVGMPAYKIKGYIAGDVPVFDETEQYPHDARSFRLLSEVQAENRRK